MQIVLELDFHGRLALSTEKPREGSLFPGSR